MQFVIIDLDKQRAPKQQELVKRYYKGFIPHVVILDAKGEAVYNQTGEIGELEISRILDRLFNAPSK